ncbi:MAG: SDR family oxidoreductase, partial [Polyangiaceae bacterium]
MSHERAESKGVAVVTGGTAGVGRATVRELARQGFDVAVLARGADGLLATRGEVEALGRRALTLSVDVSETEAVERAADRIEAELGPIDVWVNDAMATVLAPFDHVAPKDYDRATAVIYLGAVNGTRAALVRMKKRGRGSIVQVGSALAYRSVPLQACYCGAKAAIRGFTDSLRSELVHDKSNIRLSMVQLPAVNTPQFGWVKNLMPGNARPVAPTYQPEIPARAIAWAATHRR